MHFNNLYGDHIYRTKKYNLRQVQKFGRKYFKSMELDNPGLVTPIRNRRKVVVFENENSLKVPIVATAAAILFCLPVDGREFSFAAFSCLRTLSSSRLCRKKGER